MAKKKLNDVQAAISDLIGLNTAAFPTIHIEVEEIDDLICRHGVGCEVRHAIRCPCARIETTYASAGCSDCSGHGYIYPDDDLMRVAAIVLVTGRRARRGDQGAGQTVQQEGVQSLFPSDITSLAQGDQVWPDGEYHTIHQVLHRASKQVSEAATRELQTAPEHVRPVVAVRIERLVYPVILGIDAVYFKDATLDKVVKAFEVTDYTLGPRNEFRWNEGRGPDPGQGYSVRYRAPAVYIIEYDTPRFRSEAGNQMPWAVTLSRLDRWSADRDLRRD